MSSFIASRVIYVIYMSRVIILTQSYTVLTEYTTNFVEFLRLSLFLQIFLKTGVSCCSVNSALNSIAININVNPTFHPQSLSLRKTRLSCISNILNTISLKGFQSYFSPYHCFQVSTANTLCLFTLGIFEAFID